MTPKPYGYTWEKMYNAINCLVVGPGRIQERLCNAAVAAHIVLRDPEQFPPDLRELRAKVYSALTAVEHPHEGSFAASTRAMSDEEAMEIAEALLKIYFRVHKESGAESWVGLANDE